MDDSEPKSYGVMLGKCYIIVKDNIPHTDPDGIIRTYLGGVLHRTSCGAILHTNGEVEWYLYGKAYSYEEWITHSLVRGEMSIACAPQEYVFPWILEQRKALLLLEQRPYPGHKLRKFFCDVKNQESKYYDPIFYKELQRLKPNWFDGKIDYSESFDWHELD